MALLRAQALVPAASPSVRAGQPAADAQPAGEAGLTPPAAASRRPMTMADLDAVAHIEACAYSFPWSRGNFNDSLAAGYVAEVLDGADTGILGYFVAMQGVDELHLLNITVAPSWQCAGHGSLLLDAVEALARRCDLPTVWLEVRDSNLRAQALYRRRGFAAMGRRRGYYPAAGRREDAIVMRLQVQLQHLLPSSPSQTQTQTRPSLEASVVPTVTLDGSRQP